MITLNAGQQEAVDSTTHFLMTDESEMVISGPAGSGKSTVLSHIMTQFGKDQALAKIIGATELDDIILTATTNKAADMLSVMAKGEVSTIHSTLKLNVRDNYRTGEKTLSPAGGDPDEVIIRNKLIVVDECSMINRELYGFLHRRTRDCKFIFLGDHCQLAPVHETVSMVFQRGMRTCNLTKVERSANAPPITDLCNNLRSTVEEGKFFEIDEVPGFIEYVDDSKIMGLLDHYMIQPHPETSRITCFTNKRVNQFNALLRKKRGLPDHLTAGEVVVSNSSLEIARTLRISAEQEVRILNVDLKTIDFMGVDCYRVNTPFGWVTVPYSAQQVKEVLAQHKKVKNWTDFFAIKNNLADFRPVDACTVYKAQGSTYDNIFIDIGDIGTCNIANQVARMLYVANSRPRSKIFLFGQLPYCYRGG